MTCAAKAQIQNAQSLVITCAVPMLFILSAKIVKISMHVPVGQPLSIATDKSTTNTDIEVDGTVTLRSRLRCSFLPLQF